MLIQWPFWGLSVDRSFHGQERGDQSTCADALNVRNYEASTGRSRGAQRPGLARHISAQVSGSADPVRDLIHVVTVPDVAADSAELNYREHKLLAVADASIYRDASGTWTAATSGTNVFDADAPVIFSAQLDGIVYYVDGFNYVKFTSSTNTAATWTASTAGTLPTDSSNDARLICTWRRRIVLSGIASDPHNWFMSASGDPLDFDYTPDPQRETQAVAGNQHVSGECQDVITCIYPFNDDLLLIGGDHSIWQMTGDPMAGGRIDNVSDITGMAWGRPICRDPRGYLYFVGSRGGFYRMAPGSSPERLSERRIESRLDSVDLNTTLVRLFWDDRMQEVGILFTPLTDTATTHYAWDSRNGPDGRGAFWADQFGDTDLDPICVHVFDGDDPDDRTVMFGCKDGRVRYRDYDSKSDDTVAIESYALIGPIKGENLESIRMDSLQPVLDSESADVTIDLYAGESAEAAFEGNVVESYTAHAGRNRSFIPRVSGAAHYLKFGNDTLGESWAYESCRVDMSPMKASAMANFW